MEKKKKQRNRTSISERSNTMAVMEKWGVDEEINEMKVRKAASSYARIKIQNRTLKWITLGSIIFLLILLGLMISSVIIGVKITKEYKSKDGVLVQDSSGNKVLKTSEVSYPVKLSLMSSISIIESLKSLKFSFKRIDGTEGLIQFNVVSFYYAKGRNITLYGHTHMASMQSDGTFHLYPIQISNNKRSYDSRKRLISNGVNATSEIPQDSSNIIPISDCNSLLSMESSPDANYVLTGDISCDLQSPLFKEFPFTGTLDGNGNSLTVNLDYDGAVGIFHTLKGATFINVLFYGNIHGVGKCGGVAYQIYSGTNFTTCGTYFNLSCSKDINNVIIVGSFGAILLSDKSAGDPIYFDTCASNSVYSLLDNDNVTSLQGGFFGLKDLGEVGEGIATTLFKYTVFSTDITIYNNRSYADPYGFTYKVPSSKKESSAPFSLFKENSFEKKDTTYSNGITIFSNINTLIFPNSCYDFDIGDIKYINLCVNSFLNNLFDVLQVCCDGFDPCFYSQGVNCAAQKGLCSNCKLSSRDSSIKEITITPIVRKCSG